MPALNLDDLNCSMPPLKAHGVPVPEIAPDMVAYVAEMTQNERDARLGLWWNEYKTIRGDDSLVGSTAWQSAACWCDENRKFICADAAAIRLAAEKFGAMDTRPVSRMAEKVNQVNGIGEDLEKN